MKKNWLPISRGGAEINLMRTLKQGLDPKGLNPRVIWAGAWVMTEN